MYITLGKKYLSSAPLLQIVLCFAGNFLKVQLEESVTLWKIPEELAKRLQMWRLAESMRPMAYVLRSRVGFGRKLALMNR